MNVDVNQLGVTMTESPISRDQNQLDKPTAGEPEGYYRIALVLLLPFW